MAETKSRNALDGPIIKLRRGLAIYKVNLSPFYFVRVRAVGGKYIVRSTKETSRIEARVAAEELAVSILRAAPIVPTDKSFSTFCDRFIEEAESAAQRGVKYPRYAKDAKYAMDNKHWGLRNEFGGRDITTLTSADFNSYLRKNLGKRPDFSKSTVTAMTSTFRNVMKVALNDGVIATIPPTQAPQMKKGLGRPFFRFHPLVKKENDQYRALCKTLKSLAEENIKVRGVELTDEMYDLVVFLTNSFLRPTYSELYALRHSDVAIAVSGDDADGKGMKALRLTIRKGKTGARIATTMPSCVSVYERICKRHKDYKPDDYIFLPQYSNRSHAVRVTQNLFNYALKAAGLEKDPFTGGKHTMYSLRHTAICFRLVLSKGRVNIYTLAKNAGTSVEIIENHYATQLPLSNDLERNLQSFGE